MGTPKNPWEPIVKKQMEAFDQATEKGITYAFWWKGPGAFQCCSVTRGAVLEIVRQRGHCAMIRQAGTCEWDQDYFLVILDPERVRTYLYNKRLHRRIHRWCRHALAACWRKMQGGWIAFDLWYRDLFYDERYANR